MCVVCVHTCMCVTVSVGQSVSQSVISHISVSRGGGAEESGGTEREDVA